MMTVKSRLSFMLLPAVGLLHGCNQGGDTMESSSSGDFVVTANDFAQALVSQDFGAAHDMLTDTLAAKFSADDLQSTFEELIEYGTGPVRLDGHTTTLDDWPDKRAGDIGWVYVSISGDDFAEAVTLVVAEQDGEQKIRDIERGRP